MKDIVQIIDDRIRVKFDRFDQDSYATFLKVKQLPEYDIEFDQDAFSWTVTAPARFAGMLGVSIPRKTSELPVSPFLFDDQAAIVRMALAAKRFACWSGCGMGKTPIGLEFARHVHDRTGGRILIITLKEIAPQWIEEASKFYGDSMPVATFANRTEAVAWCEGAESPAWIAVTNYEKFNTKRNDPPNELRRLAGLILDESSRLAGQGKQKHAILNGSRGVEYKLSLTATPAPNEWVEFNDQARFVERIRKTELCNIYFRRDEKTHRWTIKKHAQHAFFRFMADWSIYMRDPKRFGWRLDQPEVPEPFIYQHDIPMTPEQRGFVMDYMAKAPPPAGDKSGTPSMWVNDLNFVASGKLSQAAKGFVYDTKAKTRTRMPSHKPAFVADLARKELADGLNVLIWTVFDEESRILGELLGDTATLVTGKTKERDRIDILNAFRRGECHCLVSRASMLGFGMNFQACGSMIFSGWNFSYQAWYQAVRRAYRFGQTRHLRIHVPIIKELEGQMYEAIGRKDVQSDQAAEEMEQCFADAIHGRFAMACSA